MDQVFYSWAQDSASGSPGAHIHLEARFFPPRFLFSFYFLNQIARKAA